MTICVFLADDHAVVREGLRMLLEAQPDIEVVGQSDNGRDACRQVKHLHPDVVILDIAMPELNGIEASELIHDFDPSIRIIALSMYSTREHILRARQAGALGHLLKESAAAEVIAAVREVRNGRPYLSEKVSDEVRQDFLFSKRQRRFETPLARLSVREREVLQLVAEGRSSVEIGETLRLSSKTVDTYRSRLMSKLEISDIAGLVRFAIRNGMISAE